MKSIITQKTVEGIYPPTVLPLSVNQIIIDDFRSR